MAKRPAALGKIKKPKQNKYVKKFGKPILEVAKEFVPRSPLDAAAYLVPYTRIAKVGSRAIGGITKAGSRYVKKIYRNIG